MLNDVFMFEKWYNLYLWSLFCSCIRYCIERLPGWGVTPCPVQNFVFEIFFTIVGIKFAEIVANRRNGGLSASRLATSRLAQFCFRRRTSKNPLRYCKMLFYVATLSVYRFLTLSLNAVSNLCLHGSLQNDLLLDGKPPSP